MDFDLELSDSSVEKLFHLYIFIYLRVCVCVPARVSMFVFGCYFQLFKNFFPCLQTWKMEVSADSSFVNPIKINV